ncbi:MAG: hypothetical protein R3A47_07120 [Polyangiales bacterium]
MCKNIIRSILNELFWAGFRTAALGPTRSECVTPGGLLRCAMAGAPSWTQYLGGVRDEETRRTVDGWAGTTLFENISNTAFSMFHGLTDTGPMRPAFVHEFEALLKKHDVHADVHWYPLGHDILARVMQRGKLLKTTKQTKPRLPSHVVVVTAEYRANRQHWLSVTGIDDYPSTARLEGTRVGDALQIRASKNVRSFRIHFEDFGSERPRSIQIDGQPVIALKNKSAGFVDVYNQKEAWSTTPPEHRSNGSMKRPKMSGPITDAYYDRMVHVYGTLDAPQSEILQAAAKRGARGWPLWAWDIEQPIIADTELSDDEAKRSNIVLYGSPKSNAVIRKLQPSLPIAITDTGVVVGKRTFEGKDYGVRFIFPNPQFPERYVIVQGSSDPNTVVAGNRLPEFLGDYVVFDAKKLGKNQPRTFSSRNKGFMGYFCDDWTLCEP